MDAPVSPEMVAAGHHGERSLASIRKPSPEGVDHAEPEGIGPRANCSLGGGVAPHDASELPEAEGRS